MLKRIIYLISTCIIILITIASCNLRNLQTKNFEYNTIENSIILYDQTTDGELTYRKIEMVDNNDEVFEIINNNIIYKKYGNDHTFSLYNFDMDSNTTYKLGTVKNPFIYAGRSMARIDDKLYIYLSTKKQKGKDIIIDITLYEIDTINNTLKEIITENLDKELVYIDVADNNLISFKGNGQDNKRFTYVDVISISENKKITQDILFLKEYDNADNPGNEIYGFSQYDGFIYTIERINIEEGPSYIIRKYNTNGQYIQDIILEKEIIDSINNEAISDFEIIGQFAFIRNFSGQIVLCDISKDIAVAKIIGSESFDIAFASNDNIKSDHLLFYKRGSFLLWLLDAKTSTVSRLEVPFSNGYKSIGYIFLNQESNILLSMENDNEESIFYLDYLDIPILETHSLKTEGVLMY